LRNAALSVENPDEKNTVIYPVPSDDVLYIESDSDISNILIFSNDGRQVYTGKYSNTVDVSKLASGIYYLHLLDSDKKVLQKKKILVR
jgi:hypothetical protein